MKPVRILLAEDNQGDVLLVCEALAAHQIPHRMQVAKNGAEAVDFIHQINTPGEATCPDVLLLDLNLPRMDGHEVLQEFRRHPLCASTPVIILSSSDRPGDRERVNALGVTRYFRKPTRFEAYMQLGAVVREVIGEAVSP